MKKMLRTPLVALLTLEARFALALHHPKVIAVTGNLGKTTTKDAIFSVIPTQMRARKSEKSFNSDIGVPLAILALENPWSNPLKWLRSLARGIFSALSPDFPRVLVLEVGADTPGDIVAIAKWLRPDIAIYSGVPEIPVHVANFSSREELVREKRALLEHVRPGGIIVVNSDQLPEEVTRGLSTKAVTYGFGNSPDFAAQGMRVVMQDDFPVAVEADVHAKGQSLKIRIKNAIGKPRVYAALAALAVADALGIELSAAASSLSNWDPPPGRMRVLHGVNGSIVLDDSYNSSPAAALSSLDTLQEIPGRRKIAVLGDMRELGSLSERAHREVGERASQFVDLLVTVGEESEALSAAARECGMKAENIREYGYDSSEQVGKDLAQELRAGDVVLVKGSQNRIRLERTVREILADRSQAEELLVRFDRTWRGKA